MEGVRAGSTHVHTYAGETPRAERTELPTILEWLGRALSADAVVAVHPIGRKVAAVGAFTDGDATWRRERSPISRLTPTTFADLQSRTVVDLGAQALGTTVCAEWKSARSVTEPLVLGVAGVDAGFTSTELGIFATGIGMILSRDMALVDARLNALLLERARIASEIHDGVCQEVGTLRLQLQVLQQLMESDPPRAQSLLVEVERSADLCAQNLRSALLHLAPLAPDDTWKDGGLRAFVGNVASAWGMPIAFDVNGDLTSLEPEVAALVFACVQEGLTNARKHSACGSAQVNVSMNDGHVRAEVVSGSGVPAEDDVHPVTTPFGHGLSLMRGRVRLLGGDVCFLRSDTDHAVLKVDIPA